MDSYAPLSVMLVPLYLLGVRYLAKLLTRWIPEGKVKSLLLRRIGPKDTSGPW